MSEKTVECVVAFDHLAIATGEVVGQPPLAVSTDHFKGETVTLSEEDAKRHLATGAVVKASDPQAKLIEANPPLNIGVVRALPPVPLEETASAVAGGEGATREAHSKTQLKAMNTTQLKSLAGTLGVEVGTSTKPQLIDKIAAAQDTAAAAASAPTPPVGEPGKGPGETVNPGQGDEPAQPATPPTAVE